MTPVRALIVDDDPMARAGVRAILSTDPGIEVVGEASDGDEVTETCNRLLPDVILMDLRMERVSGVEATAVVQRRIMPPKVIALTAFDLDDYVFQVLEAGAVGFVLKDSSPDELRRAVHTAVAGDAFLSPRSTRRVIQRLIARESRDQRSTRQQLDGLSEREREVAQLVWQGYSNRNIADELFVSETTVKTHLNRLMVKLDVENRVQVALVVERAGHDGGV
ncbi:response regulator [Parenemella sanctibonifatiensis]|uniref:DNA-binding response regulator n=1 Tax=Parenemella sanctibonifatiensis TaxID=2016505 RepID=A0A255E955_9ACTN|nr:response regulator transcription factor [Parenemella sanctibonifatiensis]OYN87810.1 DNA-binding response regulator [Parenemella sanctibonifatiensis]